MAHTVTYSVSEVVNLADCRALSTRQEISGLGEISLVLPFGAEQASATKRRVMRVFGGLKTTLGADAALEWLGEVLSDFEAVSRLIGQNN
ncbi:hypothetical protein [Sinimarinibacterium sp. NLF-5-8]|uniref:hypothetical protein n=1 Tax=Sinimarinibacterium sp. NLF-5-8 TaxID=2698684 RepID=UPI00137BA04C|nr:hypothetical protein [Sinimarinibacterium sp. NLF-5-8]QHS09146.1 hypothetical protein GT972_02565 [Sinimarinibacterium sp. NLF-5-8]